MVRTGQSAVRTTFSATEPKKSPLKPLRPWVAMTITSAFISAARRTMASAGEPTATRVEAFTPLSAYAFRAFVRLYRPGVVVAIAMRQEFGSWKWFGVAFAYQSALAWCVAFVIYQGGRLLGLGG